MNLSYTELFLKILAVLNYPDRETFVKGIEEQNNLEAVANCIERLSQNIRNEIKANLSDPAVLQKFIPQEIYNEEIKEVSTKALADFLQHMTPVLSDSQKEQIAAVFPQ